MSIFKEFYDLTVEDHSINIGQHLCRIYLMCFNKLDQTPYSQSDFINFRKVVDFFRNYLEFKYKYIYAHKNVAMENVVYTVYSKISQHHFRLKHHLRTSSEIDPQNDPWPMTVYDQLTKFNIMVNNSKNISNIDYKASITKLRQSSSIHSEHSLKYFAIDYFLKLLKTIVIEARDDKTVHIEPNKIISGRATASSYNSHHYCVLQNSENLFSPSLIFPENQSTVEIAIAHENSLRPKNSYSETNIESEEKTPRKITNKFKLKRYKKRRIRRNSFIEHLNKKRDKDNMQELDLNKFELNRKVFNKTIRANLSRKTLHPSNMILLNTNPSLNINNPKESVTNANVDLARAHDFLEKEPIMTVYNVQEKFQQTTRPPTPPPPPPPPPLPLKKIWNEQNESKVKPVSNFVKEKILRTETEMIPVNMMKNPHREQVGWKKAVKPQETKVDEYTHKRIDKKMNHENLNSRVCIGDKDTCINRKHKVISNKINQKIIELTKNLSMELPREISFYDDKLRENTEQSKVEPDSNTKSKLSSVQIENTSNEPSPENQNKKDLDIKGEQNESPLLEKPILSKQKTSIISNDDLFFTNRRKFSIFDRPLDSIFDTDLLNDIKGSDDDFSIHELYFKKPYHRQESNSMTGQMNFEHGEGMEISEQRRVLSRDSKEKNLTKKQLEVFDELRTMFQAEQSSGDSARVCPAIPNGHANVSKADHYYLHKNMNYFVGDSCDNKHISNPGAKKSKSQSCFYQNGSYSSLKMSRSSEILLQTN